MVSESYFKYNIFGMGIVLVTYHAVVVPLITTSHQCYNMLKILRFP